MSDIPVGAETLAKPVQNTLAERQRPPRPIRPWSKLFNRVFTRKAQQEIPQQMQSNETIAQPTQPGLMQRTDSDEEAWRKAQGNYPLHAELLEQAQRHVENSQRTDQPTDLTGFYTPAERAEILEHTPQVAPFFSAQEIEEIADAFGRYALEAPPVKLEGFFNHEEMERIIRYAQLYFEQLQERGNEIRSLADSHPLSHEQLAAAAQKIVPDALHGRHRKTGEYVLFGETLRALSKRLTEEIVQGNLASADSPFHSFLSPEQIGYLNGKKAEGMSAEDIGIIAEIFLEDLHSGPEKPVRQESSKTNTYLESLYNIKPPGVDFWERSKDILKPEKIAALRAELLGPKEIQRKLAPEIEQAEAYFQSFGQYEHTMDIAEKSLIASGLFKDSSEFRPEKGQQPLDVEKQGIPHALDALWTASISSDILDATIEKAKHEQKMPTVNALLVQLAHMQTQQFEQLLGTAMALAPTGEGYTLALTLAEYAHDIRPLLFSEWKTIETPNLEHISVVLGQLLDFPLPEKWQQSTESYLSKSRKTFQTLLQAYTPEELGRMMGFLGNGVVADIFRATILRQREMQQKSNFPIPEYGAIGFDLWSAKKILEPERYRFPSSTNNPNEEK